MNATRIIQAEKNLNFWHLERRHTYNVKVMLRIDEANLNARLFNRRLVFVKHDNYAGGDEILLARVQSDD